MSRWSLLLIRGKCGQQNSLGLHQFGTVTVKYRNVIEAPWYIVEGNDKKRARLNCIDHLLSLIPYREVAHDPVRLPNRVFNPDYERAVLPRELYVPEKY